MGHRLRERWVQAAALLALGGCARFGFESIDSPLLSDAEQPGTSEPRLTSGEPGARLPDGGECLGSCSPDPVSPDPVSPDPVNPDPVSPDPVSPDPVSGSCDGGVCGPTCAAGYADCDGAPENGCETALGTVAHCRSCNDTCTVSEGTPVCSAGVCQTRCDLTGTFALKLTASGSWPENDAMSAGSGSFETWLRVTSVHTADTLAVNVSECGRSVPPEQNKLVAETMRTLFPDAVFDAGFLPSSSATVTLSASSPGASISWPLTVTQMGVSLASPATDGWPADAADLPASSRVDMDGDGKPGVTIGYANGGGYIYPRTSSSLFSTTRADQAYVAARLGFSLGGTLSSCSAASGVAQIPLYDRGILGCNRASSTVDCTESERSILDTYKPAWTLGAASYALQALAPGADCAAVRAALP